MVLMEKTSPGLLGGRVAIISPIGVKKQPWL